MSTYTTIPNDSTIKKTAEALEGNGMKVIITENKEDAKKEALRLIPKKSEIMNMTSVTLSDTSIEEAVNDSDIFTPVRDTLSKLNRETENRKMQQIGAAPQYSIGSVHAVTEDGTVLIASNTGSQLPAYAYGSDHVIWIVGAQKIVKNLDEGMKRIYDHVLPLESERVKKAYGMDKSNVSKLLIVNKEVKPDRITLIFVKENLGF